jgi:leucyl-tRNA synthetase
MARDGHLYMSGLMKAVIELPEIKQHSKEQLAKYGLPLDEQEVLADAREFLAGEFSCQVQVFSGADPAKYDPQDKARNAVPLRPAIFIEA